MIIGESGDGKSSSIIVPPNGKLPEVTDPDAFNKLKALKGTGMVAEETIIVNCDGKDLPFPYTHFGWVEGTNLFTSTYNKPITAETLIGDPIKRTVGLLDEINAGSKYKSVIIDTMNGAMNDKEMLETRSLSWD